MADGSLRYEVAFDVKGLGETARATRNVQDLSRAVSQTTRQAVRDPGFGEVAAQAQRANLSAQQLTQALSSVARVAGAGPIAELGGHLANVVTQSQRAAGGLGLLLRSAGYVGLAVTAYQTFTAQIAEMNEEVERTAESYKKLDRSWSDFVSSYGEGLKGMTFWEDQIKLVDSLKGKLAELGRQYVDAETSKERSAIADQATRVRGMIDNVTAQPRSRRTDVEAARDAQFAEAENISMIDQFMGQRQEAERESRRQAKLRELADLGQNPEAKPRARMRARGQAIAFLGEEKGRIQKAAASFEGRAASLEGRSPEQLRDALGQQLERYRKINAIDEEIEQIRSDVRKEAQRALKSESASVSRRLGEGPAVDSLARAGLSVGAGNAGAESLRWQQASANALGRILTLMQRTAATNPAGAVALWGGS